MKKQLILLSEDKDEEVSRRAKEIISRLWYVFTKINAFYLFVHINEYEIESNPN